MLSIEFTSSSPGTPAEPAWQEIAISGSAEDFAAFADALRQMRKSSSSHSRAVEVDEVPGTLWASISTADDRLFKVKGGCEWSLERVLWEQIEQAMKDCIDNANATQPIEGYHQHHEFVGPEGPTGKLTIYLAR